MRSLQRTSLGIIFAIAFTTLVHGQPKPKRKSKRDTQYKRVHQDALKMILDKKGAQATRMLKKFLAEVPDDGESHYMLCVAHTDAGRLEEAVAAAKKGVELGVPAERFVAGNKTLLAPLGDTSFIKDLKQQFAHAPLHGPMVGNVTGKTVNIWLRTLSGAEVSAVVGDEPEFTDAVAQSETKTAAFESDDTVVLSIQGLEPNTEYFYRLKINGQLTAGEPFRFKTTSPQHAPTKFRFAFGGGAGYVPEHERMWDTIGETKPDFLLLLGDNVYSDAPASPEMQHYCYYRRQSRLEYRRLIQKTPVFSIWDDHDFGVNDCVEGPLATEPAWKLPVFNVFRNNWVNPGYGGGDHQPGCYYDFYVGDVHFIMLDGRFYRTLEPTQGGPTMLGPVQRQWLKDTIDASRGRLVVLCSPVPWVFKAKGDSRDTWNGFRSERNEIFDYLAEKGKDGVILVSADRHRSDLWRVPRPKGYPFYELNSSRLTNQHVHKTMPEAEFSYNAKQSFGLVDVDTTVADPTVRYQIVSIDGEEVFQRELRHSEMK